MALLPPLGLAPSHQGYEECPPWPPQMTENQPLDCNFYSIPEPSAMHIYMAETMSLFNNTTTEGSIRMRVSRSIT
ncbi:hypothetical protein PG985_005625 [Apiospora marii]|uniref:uncharacterized protein n=1 Tax=Apiospora marii TaxID=335849 RepID=UPI00312E7BC2